MTLPDHDLLSDDFLQSHPSDSSSSSPDIFHQVSLLSNLLQSLNIRTPETTLLSSFDIESILQQVTLVLNSVQSRSPLTSDPNPAFPILDAYRISCFALLTVQHNSTPGKATLEHDNALLKEELAQLKRLLPRDATPLLNYIRTEFSIPSTDPNQIVKELRRKRHSEKRHGSLNSIPSPSQSPKRERTEPIRSLEHLKTISTVDIAEQTRFQDVIEELSAEIVQLTGELSEEANQKAKLLALVQKQSAALAFAERQTVKSVQMRNARSDGSEILGILRTVIGQVFPRNELGSDVLQILTNPKETPVGKVRRIFELVRLVFEGKFTKLSKSHQMLTVYISSLLRFLDQLANSKDLQSWIIDGPPEVDFRPRLIAQLTRIDDFLSHNKIHLDHAISGNDFLQLPDLIISHLTEPSDPLVAIQILSEVADLIRKFSNNLQHQNNLLIADRVKLQHELSRHDVPNQDVASEITEATASFRRRLENYKSKLSRKNAVLSDVAQTLISADPSEAINLALRILEGEVSTGETSRSFEQITTDLREISFARDSAIAEAADLKEQIERQTEDLNRALIDRSELTEMVNRKDHQLTAARQEFLEEQNQIKRLNELLKEKMRLEQEQHRSAIADLKHNHEIDLENQVSQSEEKLKTAEMRITAIQERTAVRIRRLQTKLDAQIEKTIAFKDAFESKSEELRQRVEDSLKAEIEIQRLESELKLVRAELSDAHVDQRMAQLKLTTVEEQLKRERSLAKSQSQTAELSFETAHEQALADQQILFDQKLKEVLNATAEPLKEFIGDADVVTEEAFTRAVVDAVEELGQVRRKLKEVLSAESELAAIRVTLGVPEGRPVVGTVSQLLAKSTWEQWARRMHTLATGDFALAKTNEEIQVGLEEALMATQRQSGIARKLEVLRFEKRILSKGKVVPRGLTRKVSFRVVIEVVVATQKLQKLTGTIISQ